MNQIIVWKKIEKKKEKKGDEKKKIAEEEEKKDDKKERKPKIFKENGHLHELFHFITRAINISALCCIYKNFSCFYYFHLNNKVK